MASLSAGSSDRAAGPAGVSAVEVSSVTRGVALWLSRHWLDKARRKLARAGVLREGEGDTGDAGGLAVRLDITVSDTKHIDQYYKDGIFAAQMAR